MRDLGILGKVSIRYEENGTSLVSHGEHGAMAATVESQWLCKTEAVKNSSSRLR